MAAVKGLPELPNQTFAFYLTLTPSGPLGENMARFPIIFIWKDILMGLTKCDFQKHDYRNII